jgi:hypothetical protein
MSRSTVKCCTKTLIRVSKVLKVKCTLEQVLRLCTDCTARRGSRGIALPFHDHGTERGKGSASHPGRSLPLVKTRYPNLQEAGWFPGPVWTSAENLAHTGKSRPTGIWSLDPPARSQSLHRLGYPAHIISVTTEYSFSFQLIMGFGLPILVNEQSLTLGTVMKILYNVPTNSSVYLDKIFYRERRSVPKTSRWDIYSMLEVTCDRYISLVF